MRIFKSFASFILIGISAVALTITSARAAAIFTPSFSIHNYGSVPIGTTSVVTLDLALQLEVDQMVDSGSFTSGFIQGFAASEIPFSASAVTTTVTGIDSINFQFLLTYIPTGNTTQAGLDFDFFEGGINVFDCNPTPCVFTQIPQWTVSLQGQPAPPLNVIPLPAALPLFLTGLAGLGLMRRRKRQALRD